MTHRFILSAFAALALSTYAQQSWSEDDMHKMKPMAADPMTKKPASTPPMPDKSMSNSMSGGMKMDPMGQMSGMDMMGRMRGSMPGMQDKAAKTSLPGFPGASHLYHVGATGFFIDHSEHIALTSVQQKTLTAIKDKASRDKANSDRQIEQAEQELWSLTAADSPDASKIQAKIRAIETLRGNQRIAYIRSVGEAAKVLTDEQRSAVLGEKPTASDPAAHPPTKDTMQAPMKMH
jgi:Spy/CpxP family protein refolding chaperone